MSSTKEDRLKALRKLQKKRSGHFSDSEQESDYDAGKTHQESDNEQLYDVVDEKSYKDQRRQAMLNDNFVVDDDGDGGYIDNGVDEWDREDQYYSDENMEPESSKKASKSKKTGKSSKPDISSLINKHAAKSYGKRGSTASGFDSIGRKAHKVSVDMFDDIFNEFGEEKVNKNSTEKKKNFKRKMESTANGNIASDDFHDEITPETTKKLKFSSPITTTFSQDKNRNTSAQPVSSPLKQKWDANLSKKDEMDSPTDENAYGREKSVSNHDATSSKDDDDDEDDEDEILTLRRKRTVRAGNVSRTVNMKSGNSSFVTAPSTPNTSIQNISLDLDASSPSTSTVSSSFVSSSFNRFSKKLDKETIFTSKDGSIPFYWIDYSEINNTLVLYGKVKSTDGNYCSCMVQVEQMYRELYFLPKTGETPADIYDLVVSTISEKYGLPTLRAKPEKMKYAFELPGIPKRETEYLKVLVPYSTPKNSFKKITLDMFKQKTLNNQEEENFPIQHIFGASSSIFESFVVQRKIMGPCWLALRNVEFDKLTGASHCTAELKIEKATDISVLEGNAFQLPPLSTITLSVQSVLNVKENKQEIVSISYKLNPKLDLDYDVADVSSQNLETVTLMRPPSFSTFPVSLKKLAESKFPTNPVRLFNNEKGLLSCFAAILKKSDPDVFIGHKLETVGLDIIMNRMFDLKIANFSSIGRLNRREWPDRWLRNRNHQFYLIRDILSGRLVCDIANEMGQSLTPKCQSWDLSEMYNIYTGNSYKPLEINFNQVQYQEDASSLILAIEENISNCKMVDEVANKIQILSLSKQLTNLAGNNWNQTLSGNRAARNEFILLHEFAREGFILPDKEYKNNADQTNSQGRSKKSKYQGGLVFEPEKGLHKNFVLVMDFNSLYPSIIQEYNICFTTVDREHLLSPSSADSEEEALPEIPSVTKEQGVLPKLLNNLVARRREVKKLMVSESDPFKKAQCDIRQQALKLTANSMYGCLGFVNSRFYAKPLAMLVTNKGREILMNTRQLAESGGLKVVYGDTDSVMIDTNKNVYSEAIEIGQEFKKNVNDRYKLLEIDIDNVFKKLLLHAKKKYAALNCSIDPKTHMERLLLEVKGLDMKRREYCPLSKEVSEYVLNILLSDKFSDSEAALSEVYTYLEDISDGIENSKFKFDKYRINTKLSKDPTQYPGGNSMPAVQVALRMRKTGRIVKAGSVITFVITQPLDPEDQEKDKNGVSSDSTKDEQHFAARARAFTELLAKNSNLKPDAQYYLEKQIFTPIKRLLENIEGFDVVRLAESLKLDGKKYLASISSSGASANGINEIQPLESTVTDNERFRECKAFVVHCSHCSSNFKYHGIVKSADYTVSFNGIKCQKCDTQMRLIQVTSQLESRIRGFIAKYYEGWLQCDDSTCNCTTRSIGMYGKKCLNEGCTGVMNFKYTDKMLYNQLLYFSSLFDYEKNKQQKLEIFANTAEDEDHKLSASELKALVEQNREMMFVNQQVVQKYLNDCARSYVNMTDIFSFSARS
ncbi:DNA polymerase alpha catalytic subunit A [Hanseniaspora osmophila]|uniref:DNA polymerase n=1 Tax=Hanseniaspora osmophila TaxID=56408 RepID=A0A1E5RNC6_9ASCO|nr:DNA polymerase alpha catalytic subunit A [Hanseniaspora osmophila]